MQLCTMVLCLMRVNTESADNCVISRPIQETKWELATVRCCQFVQRHSSE